MDHPLLRGLVGGIAGAASFNTSALYRYPYRTSAEAFRGDWLKIGRDINNALEREEDDER